MPEERLGATFSIDTTNLKAGLQQANRMIRESESEFKAAAAKMDDWTSSSEGLQARITYLNRATDLQKEKVKALQSQYNRLVSQGMDPASKQAVELRTKINKEQTALNKNKKELKEQKQALEDMSDESEKAADSTDDLAKSAKDSGDGFTIAGGAIAGFIANSLSALVSKIGEAISSLFGLAESTRELRTEMGKLETGFTTAGFTAEDATKTYTDLFSVLGDSGKATEAAGHLSLLANNSEDLAKWTEICTGVYAQFGDSLPIEGLTEASNETAKTGKLTGVLADALNWAGVNEDDFQKKLDKCTTEQERQSLITETLNGLYSEQADTYKELNKDVIDANRAAADMVQAQADLGAAMEPLTTKITELKTSILEGLTPALKGIISTLNDVFEGVEGSPERLANQLSEMLDGMISKLTEMLPKVAEFATQLVFMVAQVIIENLPAIVDAAVQMFSTFLETLAKMAPSLIATIVDTVVLIAETLIDNIDLVIDAGVKLILGLADGLIEALPRLIDKIPVIIDKLVSALVKNLPKLVEAGIKLTIKLQEGMIKAIPQLISKIPEIIKNIVTTLVTEGIPALIDVGKQLIEGLWEGIKSAFNWLSDKINDFCDSVVGWFKNAFGIHSPSRVLRDQVGNFMGQGLALGIEDGFGDKIDGVNKAIVRSLESPTITASVNASGTGTQGGGRSVVVNQYNTYSQAHSRYELFKAKQATAAAVRLAMGGSNL